MSVDAYTYTYAVPLEDVRSSTGCIARSSRWVSASGGLSGVLLAALLLVRLRLPEARRHPSRSRTCTIVVALDFVAVPSSRVVVYLVLCATIPVRPCAMCATTSRVQGMRHLAEPARPERLEHKVGEAFNGRARAVDPAISDPRHGLSRAAGAHDLRVGVQIPGQRCARDGVEGLEEHAAEEVVDEPRCGECGRGHAGDWPRAGCWSSLAGYMSAATRNAQSMHG